jgi:hypothetical protein
MLPPAFGVPAPPAARPVPPSWILTTSTVCSALGARAYCSSVRTGFAAFRNAPPLTHTSWIRRSALCAFEQHTLSPQRGFIPFEAFHSSVAVPHHCGRFPLAVVVPHLSRAVPRHALIDVVCDANARWPPRITRMLETTARVLSKESTHAAVCRGYRSNDLAPTRPKPETVRCHPPMLLTCSHLPLPTRCAASCSRLRKRLCGKPPSLGSPFLTLTEASAIPELPHEHCVFVPSRRTGAALATAHIDQGRHLLRRHAD